MPSCCWRNRARYPGVGLPINRCSVPQVCSQAGSARTSRRREILAWIGNVPGLRVATGFHWFRRHYTEIPLASGMREMAPTHALVGIGSPPFPTTTCLDCRSDAHLGRPFSPASASLADPRGTRQNAEIGQSGGLVWRSFAIIARLPLRVTVFGLALVGSLEPALYRRRA